MYFVARSLFGLWAFMPVAVTMTETMTNSLITNDTFLPSRKSVEQWDDIIFEFVFLLKYVLFIDGYNGKTFVYKFCVPYFLRPFLCFQGCFFSENSVLKVHVF